MDGGNDTSDERKNRLKDNKILWGVFGGLCVVAVGLGIGVVVNLVNNNEEITVDPIENIMENGEKEVAMASNNEEKARAYINRAYNLSENQSEDEDYCWQIEEDIANAKDLTDDEDINMAADTLIHACVPVESSEFIKTGDGIETGGESE